MRARAFAGRFAPRGGTPRASLQAALRRDGPAAVADSGPLALAWTPVSDPRPALCVVDGTPSTAALAEELGLDPATPPDVVLGKGFALLGDVVVERVEGSFAAVAWDAGRARGLLARDRFGDRPLFMVESGGSLLFASEIRILLELLPARPGPDRTAMVHWLARTRVSDDRTLYAGIRRLPAAHLLAFDRDGWRQRRYWSPRYAEPRAVGIEEATTAVRDGIAAAVERSLEGAAHPAIMLSGGLDSSAVAAMAPRPLAAYSAVFPGDGDVDESARIARVREWLGLGGVEQRFRCASALAAGAEFMREWEVPSVSPNLLVWSPLLRRAASDGVDVVLDGEGGDELFGCARYLVADRLRSGRPLAALRVARRLPGMGDRPPARWIGRALASYGVRAALPPTLHQPLRSARGHGAAGPDWLTPAAERIHRTDDDPWAWKRAAAPRWWAELAHTLTQGGDALGAPDQLRREALLTGVELRHPLRDPELVGLALALPPELAFHPHLDRPLVRRALAGRLPPELLDGDEKPAFNTLLRSAFDGPDRAALRALLSDPRPELARLVRRDAIATMAASPSARPRGWDLNLWRIATLEMWLRHIEGAGAPVWGNADPAAGTDISFFEVLA